jgi:hypothetical protein
LRDLEKSEAIQLGRTVVSEDVDMNDSEKDVVSGNTAVSNSLPGPSAETAVFGPTKMYNLDDSVDVWSDFLRPHIHHRSVHIIDNYQYQSEVEPFDIYGLGVQTCQESQCKADIEDLVHFFTEECDNLQGFQLLVDVFDGFGGLAASVLEDIRDDFPNKYVALFSLTPATFLNTAFTRKFCHIILCVFLVESS